MRGDDGASGGALRRLDDGPRRGWLAWTVPAEGGGRLDLVLGGRFPSWSRELWKKAIRRGWVLVDGGTRRPSSRLRGGEELLVHPDVARLELEGLDEPLPEAPPIPRLHEDEDLLVVHKPAGTLVHGSSPLHRDALVDRLSEEEGAALHVVHRLDRLTSGVLVLARRPAVADRLRELFDGGASRKVYLAVVRGRVDEAWGEIRRPLGPLEDAPVPGMVACRDDGAPSRSSFHLLHAGAERSLLALELHTGRKHQLRVHLASKGWPIVGELLYDGGPDEDWYGGSGAGRGLGHRPAWHGLHAWRLALPHPVRETMLHVVAPPRGDFRALLDELADEEAPA